MRFPCRLYPPVEKVGLELVSLLREAFFYRKHVRLEYRYVGDLRYIMAAWVNA